MLLFNCTVVNIITHKQENVNKISNSNHFNEIVEGKDIRCQKKQCY